MPLPRSMADVGWKIVNSRDDVEGIVFDDEASLEKPALGVARDQRRDYRMSYIGEAPIMLHRDPDGGRIGRLSVGLAEIAVPGALAEVSHILVEVFRHPGVTPGVVFLNADDLAAIVLAFAVAVDDRAEQLAIDQGAVVRGDASAGGGDGHPAELRRARLFHAAGQGLPQSGFLRRGKRPHIRRALGLLGWGRGWGRR